MEVRRTILAAIPVLGGFFLGGTAGGSSVDCAVEEACEASGVGSGGGVSSRGATDTSLLLAVIEASACD